MKSHCLALGLLPILSLLAAAPGLADCVDYEDHFHLEASLELPGAAFGIAVSEHYAYVAQSSCLGGQSCLDIVDIENPADPRGIGHIQLPTWGVRVAVSGGYAYVSEEGYQQETPALQVIDVSDPQSPKTVGAIGLPPGVGGIAVSGSHAFVANGAHGLQIIDVSDPTHPRRRARLETDGSACAVAFQPGVPGSRPRYAYVADGYEGLLVIDLASLRFPRIVGRAALGEWVSALDLVVLGDYAYVAGDCSGLFVVDISVPDRPEVVGQVDTPGCAYGIAVEGSRVFIADDGFGFQVIDVSDPVNPRIAGSVNCAYMYGCTVVGDHAFIAAYERGLQVIDVAGEESVQPIGSLRTIGQAQGLTVSGSHAFLACGEQGLQVVDVAEPEQPALVGGLDTPGWASRPTLLGDYVCFPDGGSVVRVIDISDPTLPEQVARIDTHRAAAAVAANERHLFVAEDYYFQIFDLLQPWLPVLVGNLPEVNAGPITVGGDYVYVAGWNELQVIDVSDPSNPVQVAEIAMFGTTGLAASGSYLFVAVNYMPRLCIVDISTPCAPQIVSSVDSSYWVTDVTVAGDMVYLASYEGVQVVDVEDCLNPHTLGGGDTVDLANGVVIANGVAYLTLFGHGTFSGLVILPSQCAGGNHLETSGASDSMPAGAAFLHVEPNPVRRGDPVRFTLPIDGFEQARIHDATGRLVRRLALTPMSLASQRLEWDGSDEHRRPVPAGIYFIRVDNPRCRMTSRVVVLD